MVHSLIQVLINKVMIRFSVFALSSLALLALAVRAAIDQAFVFGFRLVMVICALLSLVSAIFAWWMITGQVRARVD